MEATIEAEIIIGECECMTCGAVYDFEGSGAANSDQCPRCADLEEAEARAAEAREEAIDDARSDLEEAEADLDGMMEEMAELRARIAEARRAVRSARRKLERLEAN